MNFQYSYYSWNSQYKTSSSNILIMYKPLGSSWTSETRDSVLWQSLVNGAILPGWRRWLVADWKMRQVLGQPPVLRHRDLVYCKTYEHKKPEQRPVPFELIHCSNNPAPAFPWHRPPILVQFGLECRFWHSNQIVGLSNRDSPSHDEPESSQLVDLFYTLVGSFCAPLSNKLFNMLFQE